MCPFSLPTSTGPLPVLVVVPDCLTLHYSVALTSPTGLLGNPTPISASLGKDDPGRSTHVAILALTAGSIIRRAVSQSSLSPSRSCFPPRLEGITA